MGIDEMRYALEFTTRIGCALACGFCPQTQIKAAYKGEQRMLDVEDFKLMLAKAPKTVEIHFSGFTEPFLNPYCADMIEHACNEGYPVHLYTTLVGLSDDQADVLRRHKLAAARIHAPDGKHFKYPSALWVRLLDRFVQTHQVFTCMAMGPIEEDLRAMMEQRDVPVELPQMLSRAGNLGWNRPGGIITGPLTCEAERWHMNVVLPNGDVVGCSMQYGMEIMLGNLLRDEYADIVDKAALWREETNPPEDSPCRRCEWAKTVP